MISVWSDGDSSVWPGVGVALTRPLFVPSRELIMVISYPLVPHVRFVGRPTRWPPAMFGVYTPPSSARFAVVPAGWTSSRRGRGIGSDHAAVPIDGTARRIRSDARPGWIRARTEHDLLPANTVPYED